MLLALTATWGSAFMLTKVAVTGLPPDQVVVGRLLIAALLLVPTAALYAKRPMLSGRFWIFHALMAVFGYALPFSLISWGQGFIDSGLAGILMAVMPLATLGLAHFLVPGERMTAYRIGGFLLGFSGVVVLMGPTAWSGLAAGGDRWLPMLAVLCGALSYAVSAILARLRPDGDALFSAAVTTSIAGIMAMVLLAMNGNPVIVAAPKTSTVITLGLLGIFSTALAAILYFRLVKSAGPAFVSQLNYLIPLWAVGCGILFLHEEPETNQLLALALILGGILVTHLEQAPGVTRRPKVEGDSGGDRVSETGRSACLIRLKASNLTRRGRETP
jgi:drug/metabolite transporter (DMT)-like permease